MKDYKNAFDRLRRSEDGYGREIWVERMGKDKKPDIFYRYNSKGRLMKYSRTLYGYSVDEAEFVRFGEKTVNSE